MSLSFCLEHASSHTACSSEARRALKVPWPGPIPLHLSLMVSSVGSVICVYSLWLKKYAQRSCMVVEGHTAHPAPDKDSAQ